MSPARQLDFFAVNSKFAFSDETKTINRKGTAEMDLIGHGDISSGIRLSTSRDYLCTALISP